MRLYEFRENGIEGVSGDGELLKVPKCEILMSWILMIFYHEVYIGRGLEG